MTGSSRVVVAVAVALAAACTPGARPRLGLGEICTDSSECLAGRGCFEIVSGRPLVCGEVCFGAADDCDWPAYPDAFCHSPGRPPAGYCVVPCSDDARCPGDLVCGSVGHCVPPAGGWRVVAPTIPYPIRRVDMVVMVDNSGSMTEEQRELATRYRWFIRDLVDPPDRNADTLPDYPAVEDLNIGVISSDMGVMGYRGIRSCELADFGDDGCFRNTPSRTVPGCPAYYSERWLSRNPANAGSYSPDQMADDFACIGTLGIDGCGFEQPLKAMRKAVVDNQGIGGCNAGFLRPDSIVTLIFVTDEDDCSVSPDHPYMFDPARIDLGGMSLRCFRNPDKVQSVSEYVTAFRSLREDASRIFIAMIVGVPLDPPVCEGDGDTLGACLAVPAMIPRPDATGERVEPSCLVPDMGTAHPPVRFVQLAMDIEREGVDTYVSSICRADWTDAIQAIADRIGNRISSGVICFTPELPFDRDRCEAPGCRVVAHLRDAGPCPADPRCPCAGGTCADPYTGEPCVPLYLDDGIGVETGRRWRRCIVRQAARTAGPDGCSGPLNDGWYWQPVSPEGCGVFEFHDAWEGAAFSMECRDVP